jgi:site-specific DNA-methyltransferase (adenine-specific)
MNPYYDRDGITIYHGDCREILPHVKADVVVTDPPFGMAYCSGWQERPIANDHDTSARDAFLAAWSPRPAVVFGRWDCPRPENVRARLIWDKGEWPGMGDLKFPWGPSDEEAYVIGDGFSGRRMGTVLRVRRLPGAALIHPNEKPPELLQIILQRCPPGLILDPFMGSGTTLVAAKLEGRKAIGIEIEERYCEIAAKRLAQGVLSFP